MKERGEARGEKRGASDRSDQFERESLTFGMRTTGLQVHPGSPVPRFIICIRVYTTASYVHYMEKFSEQLLDEKELSFLLFPYFSCFQEDVSIGNVMDGYWRFNVVFNDYRLGALMKYTGYY